MMRWQYLSRRQQAPHGAFTLCSESDPGPHAPMPGNDDAGCPDARLRGETRTRLGRRPILRESLRTLRLPNTVLRVLNGR